MISEDYKKSQASRELTAWHLVHHYRLSLEPTAGGRWRVTLSLPNAVIVRQAGDPVEAVWALVRALA